MHLSINDYRKEKNKDLYFMRAKPEPPGVNDVNGLDGSHVVPDASGSPGPFGLGSAETIPTTDNPAIAYPFFRVMLRSY